MGFPLHHINYDNRLFIKKFIEHGEKLRLAQKGFFNERDPVKKREFLNKSKKAEKEFDNSLFNARQLVK